MGRIYFTTIKKIKNGTVIPVVRLSRETSGKDGSIFDIDIYPDGRETYQVNSQPVDVLPNFPSVNELRKTAVLFKERIVQLLGHPFQSEPYNNSWWGLKKAIEEL